MSLHVSDRRTVERSVAKSTRPAAVAPPAQNTVAPHAPSCSRAAMWAQAMEAPSKKGVAAAPSLSPLVAAAIATPGTMPLQAGAVNSPGAALQQVKAQARQVASRVIQSKVLTALIVFLFTVLLLVVFNPPMAQQPCDPEDTSPRRRSWKKIMVWSALVFALALLLPVAASFCTFSAGSGSQAQAALNTRVTE
jgi:hypothetical protein